MHLSYLNWIYGKGSKVQEAYLDGIFITQSEVSSIVILLRYVASRRREQ